MCSLLVKISKITPPPRVDITTKIRSENATLNLVHEVDDEKIEIHHKYFIVGGRCNKHGFYIYEFSGLLEFNDSQQKLSS
ncbi:hypothetical protein ABG067_000982 [Albugo candida]